MPVPVVAIQVEFVAEPSAMHQLLEACDAGVGPDACALASDSGATGAPYLAYVSWLDEARRQALVEVGPRAELRGSFEFRRLKFTEGDAPHERWQAIGLTVATLLGSGSAPEPLEPQPMPAVEPPAEQATPRAWRAGVSARVGSGFSTWGASVGLGVSLAYDLPDLPLFPLAFGGWRTATERGITGQWWEAGVGLGARKQLGPLRVALMGLVTGQWLGVSASRADSSDSGRSSTSGVSGALEIAWPASGAVGGTLGLQLLEVARATEVRSSGTVVLETPRASYGASLGLEGRF